MCRVTNINDIWSKPALMEELLVWLVKTHDEAGKKKADQDKQRKEKERAEKKKEDFSEMKFV